MDDLSDAAKAVMRKRNVPSELVSEDWNAVDGWLRERAFFMSGVMDAQILQAFRREAELMAAGKSSGSESMNRLMLFLERVGYKPAPGDEGTIKDLSSWQRMSVSLDTNVAMARGYGMWARAQKSLRAFPAWEFIRIAERKHPRKNWDERWEKAHALTASIPGALLSPQIALINHPIWKALSAFGNAYPPYDWNSGKGVRIVSRKRSKELGLLDDPRTRPMWEQSALASPNESTEVTPDISERHLRQALSERLMGIAEWQGEKLVMTDPNGTRPYTARALADLWRRELPEPIEPRQKEAFIEWVRDSRAFNRNSDWADPLFVKGTDRWDDMTRFLDRLENESPIDELWRGMSMNRENLDGFLKAIENGYAVRAVTPAESWSNNLLAAQNYSKWNDDQKWSVILNVKQPTLAKDITPLVREFTGEIGKQKVPGVEVDAEWLYKSGTRFRVASINRNAEKRQVEITLEEDR